MLFKGRRKKQPAEENASGRRLTLILSAIAGALSVVLVVMLLFSLAAGGEAPGGSGAGNAAGGAAVSTLTLTGKPEKKSAVLTTEQAAVKILPCIVGIVQYRQGSLNETGEGSGIVMSADGKIITNYHVIEGASRLEVVMPGGKKYQATVIGSDARTDLAVIKVSAKKLKFAQFGNSDQSKVGEQVIAVGNPSGLQLAGSVTQGIISALNRNVDVGNGPMNLIQTDAAINPGNSGGALVNMYGQVIGITSSKIEATGYEGMGFAIPINTAQPIINSIIKYGYVTGRVKIGISVEEYTGSTAYGYPSGLRIVSIDSSSDAASKGLQENDIITKINGISVTSYDQFYQEESKYKAGQTITLTVFRYTNKSTLTYKVTLAEDKGDTTPSSQESSSNSDNNQNGNGFSTSPYGN